MGRGSGEERGGGGGGGGGEKSQKDEKGMGEEGGTTYCRCNERKEGREVSETRRERERERERERGREGGRKTRLAGWPLLSVWSS